MMALKCRMCSWKVTAFRAVEILTGCAFRQQASKKDKETAVWI